MTRLYNGGMKTMFISIFALTVGDALCTAAGILYGWMSEGNVLLRRAVADIPVVSCAAVALSVGLILLWLWRVKDRVRWLKYPLAVTLCVKAEIMTLHAVIISRAICCGVI